VPSADVVLAPYSAVLMPDARDSLGIQLQDSVLVFDEAHNLLDAINGAHSTTVTCECYEQGQACNMVLPA
jgi:chromosome transmission fidelity protein 1